MAMAKLSLKSTRSKFTDFQGNGIFLDSNRIYIGLLAQIRNQRPKIGPCAKFLPNSNSNSKGKGSRILTWNDSENCWMTSYARDSDDIIKVFNF